MCSLPLNPSTGLLLSSKQQQQQSAMLLYTRFIDQGGSKRPRDDAPIIGERARLSTAGEQQGQQVTASLTCELLPQNVTRAGHVCSRCSLVVGQPRVSSLQASSSHAPNILSSQQQQQQMQSLALSDTTAARSSYPALLCIYSITS